jgi:hypothetical protein
MRGLITSLLGSSLLVLAAVGCGGPTPSTPTSTASTSGRTAEGSGRTAPAPDQEAVLMAINNATAALKAAAERNPAAAQADLAAKVDAFNKKVDEYVKGVKERINTLEGQVQAQGADKARDAAVLQEQLAEQKRQLERLQKLLEEFAKQQAKPQPDTPPDITQVIPPTERKDGNGDPKLEEQIKALMKLALAALCVYQPELCALLSVFDFGLDLFGGDTKTRDEFYDTVRKMATGGDVGPDVLDRLAQAAREGKLAPKELGDLGNLAKNLPPAFQERGKKVMDDLRKQIVPTQGPVRQIYDKLVAGPVTPDDLKALLPKPGGTPHFTNNFEKKAVELLLTSNPAWAGYWSALKDVPVLPGQ